MKIKLKLMLVICCMLCTTVFAIPARQSTPYDSILYKYLRDNSQPEHISTVALTISPNSSTMDNIDVGSSTYNGTKEDVTDMSLFQIGSITKSFTSVILLKLQEEGKLSLNDKVGKYFPKYKQWSNITIRQLLNMTAGIPDYYFLSGFSAPVGHNLQTHFSPEDILNIAYGKPLNHGYYYSNTNYILAGMIAAKVAKKPFPELMHDLIKSAGLKNTFYVEGIYPHSVTNRMVSGYYHSLLIDNLNPLILSTSDPECVHGKKTTDIKCSDMSWAGSAGGIVSNQIDVTKWVRELFTAKGSTAESGVQGMLTADSLLQLKSIVSTSNGIAIQQVTKDDTQAFGLGIVKAYRPSLGAYYYYQGETLGYRVLYAYIPQDPKSQDGKGLIITIAVNSQPVDSMNHLGSLIEDIYKQYKAINK